MSWRHQRREGQVQGELNLDWHLELLTPFADGDDGLRMDHCTNDAVETE
jgi:hypothetical protein